MTEWSLDWILIEVATLLSKILIFRAGFRRLYTTCVEGNARALHRAFLHEETGPA